MNSVDNDNATSRSNINCSQCGSSALNMLCHNMHDSCVSSSIVADVRSALAVMAENSGYVIHDVPSDGDCLFSAVSSVGLQPMSAQELRADVVQYICKKIQQ